jgi:hypothetical protein
MAYGATEAVIKGILGDWDGRPSKVFRLLVKKTPCPDSASELYRLSDRRLSAKLAPTFADRGCDVVSVTDPYGSILGFLGRSRYYCDRLLSAKLAPTFVDRGCHVVSVTNPYGRIL